MIRLVALVLLLSVAFVADPFPIGCRSKRDDSPRPSSQSMVSDTSQYVQYRPTIERGLAIRSYGYEAPKASECVLDIPQNDDYPMEIPENNAACCDQIHQCKTKKPKVYGCCSPTCKRPGHNFPGAIGLGLHARGSSTSIISYGRFDTKRGTGRANIEAGLKNQHLSYMTKKRKLNSRPYRNFDNWGMRTIIDRVPNVNDKLTERQICKNTNENTVITCIKACLVNGSLPENSKGYKKVNNLSLNGRNKEIYSSAGNRNTRQAFKDDQALDSVPENSQKYIYRSTNDDAPSLPMRKLDPIDETAEPYCRIHEQDPDEVSELVALRYPSVSLCSPYNPQTEHENDANVDNSGGSQAAPNNGQGSDVAAGGTAIQRMPSDEIEEQREPLLQDGSSCADVEEGLHHTSLSEMEGDYSPYNQGSSLDKKIQPSNESDEQRTSSYEKGIWQNAIRELTDKTNGLLEVGNENGRRYVRVRRNVVNGYLQNSMKREELNTHTSRGVRQVHRHGHSCINTQWDWIKGVQKPNRKFCKAGAKAEEKLLNTLRYDGEGDAADEQPYEDSEEDDVKSTNTDGEDGVWPEMTSTDDKSKIFGVTGEDSQAKLKVRDVDDPESMTDDSTEMMMDVDDDPETETASDLDDQTTTSDTMQDIVEVTEKGFTPGLKPGEVGDPGDVEDDYYDDEELDDGENNFNVTERVKQRRVDAQGWYSWSLWSTCSVTCGMGKLTRRRVCGKTCEDGATEGTEAKPCEMPQCKSFSIVDIFRPPRNSTEKVVSDREHVRVVK